MHLLNCGLISIPTYYLYTCNAFCCKQSIECYFKNIKIFIELSYSTPNNFEGNKNLFMESIFLSGSIVDNDKTSLKITELQNKIELLLKPLGLKVDNKKLSLSEWLTMIRDILLPRVKITDYNDKVLSENTTASITRSNKILLMASNILNNDF